MKKISIILLILLFSTIAVFAVTSTTTFTINAYKVGTYNEEHISMEAYDALQETLTKIVAGEKLDLSPYTSNLKNNSADSSYSVEPYNRHVIFSFHVDGNCNGSYKLSVSIGPLKHVYADGTERTTNTITAYYEMRDVSCVFTSTYKSTGEKGEFENWRVQGSVGISIDRATYKTAADTTEYNGLYMADVTITLEVT